MGGSESIKIRGGGRVPSPWNTSPELPCGWVGARGKNDELPQGNKSGIFRRLDDLCVEFGTTKGIPRLSMEEKVILRLDYLTSVLEDNDLD